MIRLQKILSAAGVASRRASEQLLAEGRVSVNGKTVRELGTKADPTRDDIRVDGRRIRSDIRQRYILLYKPRGYVTTRHDPEGRPTVVDLLGKNAGYIYPVGRLDYDSEGLLLMTTDGELAERLTHPRHEVERVYEAIVAGNPDESAIDKLRRGVYIDGRRTSAAEIFRGQTVKSGSPTTKLTITLREGRNRQIRKMCLSVGHPVRSLTRISMGPLSLGRLKPGEWRELTPIELASLQDAAEATPAGTGRDSGSRAARTKASQPSARTRDESTAKTEPRLSDKLKPEDELIEDDELIADEDASAEDAVTATNDAGVDETLMADEELEPENLDASSDNPDEADADDSDADVDDDAADDGSDDEGEDVDEDDEDEESDELETGDEFEDDHDELFLDEPDEAGAAAEDKPGPKTDWGLDGLPDADDKGDGAPRAPRGTPKRDGGAGDARKKKPHTRKPYTPKGASARGGGFKPQGGGFKPRGEGGGGFRPRPEGGGYPSSR